ncbi:SLC13 family permease [Siminovitchia fortis]|uniref:SLC13 family permease n=1 Tax=Siminovitchia fortis TaxID=254758 RepID=A0A443IWT7_9BACI|nr:SLC13 family permease [Siminovitchia fortis]RWR12546.1 SLC13 family permease [Siminovitchia fortis]WHY81609.1 SLC13 family permease [Siminovitchia fortis]
MIIVLLLIVMMLIALLLELARPELIIFLVLVTLLLLGIITPEQALSGFSNEGMITIALLFIVAGAVQKSGLIDDVMERWLEKSKTEQESKLRFFIPIAGLSAFLNNTPIVVTFTPIIKNWCEKRGIAPSKFLIPLSYVTILGGTITLMGTSTNIVVHGMLLEYGFEGFSLFTITVVGIPVTIAGMLYLFTIGDKLLPDHKGFSQRVKEDAKEYIAELRVKETFPYVNQSVKKSGLGNLNGLYLIEIIRRNERVSPVRNSTIIQAGDRLVFTGQISTMAELQSTMGLTLETGTNLELDDLKNGSIYLVEAVVSHHSSLLSKSVKQTQFRSRYDAGVIAVHRKNEKIQSKVGDIILKPGDALLLLAGEDFIKKYKRSNDFYVVSRLEPPKLLTKNKFQGLCSIGILLAMIILVSFGLLSMLKAMALAVIILLVSRMISAEEIMSNVQFHVLLIIACSLGIGTAMTKTGLAEWTAKGLMAISAPIGVVAVLTIMYLLTSVFTELLTNSAAAAIMLPIGLELSSSLQLDPTGFAVLVAIAASASFITPIGYQTNLIVYGPGGYRFIDYIKIGTPLSFIVMITSVTVIYFVWF